MPTPQLTEQSLRKITRAEWAAALRSGEYTQTTGRLRDRKTPKTMCCLGVGLDLCGFKWGRRVYRNGNSLAATPYAHQLLGIGFAKEDELIAANDGGKTFAEIADMLDGGQPHNGTR